MKRTLSLLLVLVMVLSMVAVLSGCSTKEKVIMLWGPEEHRDIYLKYANQFKEQNPDAFKGYTFDFAGSGNAGAYANMSVDPTKGAAIYSFPNDQMANLANLNALSPLGQSDMAWNRENNSAASIEAGKLGEKYMAYPLQADNGFFMYYRKDVFEGTSVWDAEKGTLKEGYTFRDLYAAIEEKGGSFANAKVSWAFGDSWYVSGVFFALGGDYEVVYNSEGKQTSASCNFTYTLPEGVTNWKDGDYTLGETAVELMLNTFMNADGTLNPHFLYTDSDKVPYNDTVSTYTNPANPQAQETPLVATVNGTWKYNELLTNWGEENLGAAPLPMLEDNEGNKYAWKTFAGYQLLGVNPLCEFVQDNPENITILHQLAQYISDCEAQLERFNASGAGPSNLKALENEAVKNNVALQALNAQYARECVYPAGHEKAGQPIGNGLGMRVQDSVPANYWTPIANFAQVMWQEYSAYLTEGKALSTFSASKLHRTLADLQAQIEQSTQ